MEKTRLLETKTLSELSELIGDVHFDKKYILIKKLEFTERLTEQIKIVLHAPEYVDAWYEVYYNLRISNTIDHYQPIHLNTYRQSSQMLNYLKQDTDKFLEEFFKFVEKCCSLGIVHEELLSDQDFLDCIGEEFVVRAIKFGSALMEYAV